MTFYLQAVFFSCSVCWFLRLSCHHYTMLCAVWASAAKAYFFISTFPRYNSQPPHRGTFPQAGRLAAFRQHRTIPALRLKHRSGSCGTASALPKCSIMSGCDTRIVLRGQKPSHSATAAPASVRCFRHWRRSPLQHPVLSALLAWQLPHLARRIGT